MRKVSAREFQVHGSKYLKKLPIVLTRHNIPIATIIPYVDVTRQVITGEDKVHISIPTVVSESVEDLNKVLVEPISKYPNNYMGKPLSGKTARCHICNEENIPVEFAQKHYNERHEDL